VAETFEIKGVLESLCEREDLTFADAKQALSFLVDEGDPAKISAFLVLLRAKGETAMEVAGLASAMQDKMSTVKVDKTAVDIVGTGGDSAGTVNISTGACVLTAACGLTVAKHGNRSVSSLCGSADVLENLGVVIDLGPEQMEQCLAEADIGFMFAPRFHPAMKAVVPVRRSLKVRTAFNILGPMLNPARIPYALVGVYSRDLSKLMADSLLELGFEKALVVNSMGIDELTPAGPADVVEISKGKVREYKVYPKDLGIPSCELEDLKGGDASVNAQMLLDVFGGEQNAVADALILNSGFALATANFAKDPAEGVAMAREVQRSGKAAAVMEKWAETTQKIANAGK
jgi:anthranilate phosphoribosyltransferase